MKKLLLVLLIGMFMISFSSAALVDDITSYYKLDDNLATTNVIDTLGINDGTSNGNTNTFSTSGKINTAFSLLKPTRYVNISTEGNSPFNYAGDFSISFWFKPSNKTSLTNIMGSDLGTLAYGGYAIWYSGSGQLQYISNDNIGQPQTRTSGVDLTLDQWHHAVFTKTGTDGTWYIDGSSWAGGYEKDDSLRAIQATTKQFQLSSDSQNNDKEFGLDEVGFWNKSLDSDEVSTLWNGGNGLTYPFIAGISVELDYPEIGDLLSSNVTFNSTLTPSNTFNLTNATLFIWDSDGELFFTETNIVTGNESNTTSFLVNNLTLGSYEWNVFGSSENSTGYLSANFSASNNTFSWVPFEVDNEEFNSNVYETSRQEFLLNITTLSSVLSVDSTLNYNGTKYTADTSCSSGLCQISTAIDIPLVVSGSNENKSFFWEISVFDGSNSFSTNLTANEQNVTRLYLEKCNSTYTVQTLNFTAFDEQTESEVSPFMFDGSFEFWIGTGTVKRNNSISNSSLSSLQLCFTPSEETLYLDSTIEYDEASGANYTRRNYFFQNDTITNVSQDIGLGLLLSEDSTSFILQVQDRDILPVADVLIFTERYYPGDGTYRVVQVSQTDDNGGTVGFFETETVDYRFVLKQNGETVLITNKQKIVGESVPFTLTFTIGDDEGAAWDPFEEVDDLQNALTYNKSSNVVSFTYLDTSGNFTLAQLIVERVNASGLQNTIVCSKNSSQSSATITCNMTGNSTGQYIARTAITRDSSAFLVEQLPFAIEDFSTIAGNLGLLLGWFVILIASFAFKFNEVAGIILINLAIIMVNLIGLVSFGYVFISAIAAISIIILVVLER